MGDYRLTRSIAAPLEIVWNTMTDHERYADWCEARRVTLDPPGSVDRNGLGAVRVFHIAGPLVTREEVTAWAPPRSMTYRVLGVVPARNYLSTMTLTDDSPSSTTLHWTSSWTSWPSVLDRGAALMVKRSLERFADEIRTAAEAVD